jgi:streptogramin lyase
MARQRSLSGAVILALAVMSVALIPAGMAGGQTWTFDEFPLPSADAWPQAMTVDGSGNLWFVEVGRDHVGRLIPAQATPGASNGFSEFALSVGAWPHRPQSQRLAVVCRVFPRRPGRCNIQR